MGTRAVVGTPHGQGWRGRYVHWSGSPAHLGRALRRIVERDGLPVASRVITTDHYGWSELTGADSPELLEGYTDGRFAVVPGYGIAYTTEQDQSSPDEWFGPEDLEPAGIEWVYVLTHDGLAIWSVDPDGRMSVHVEV